MKKWKEYGLLFAILSPVFSSVATIFLGGAAKLLHPFVITSFVGVVGGLILLGMTAASGESKKLKKAKAFRNDLAILTVLRPLIGSVIFAFGLSMTDAIKAIFFTKAEPYFVLGCHWKIKGERPKPSQLALLTVHVAGAIILSTGGVLALGAAQLGDLLVIIAIGFFSLSYVYAARLSKALGAKASNGITLLIAGLALLPLAALFLPIEPFANPLGWQYLVANVILFNVISLTLWFASLKTVEGWIVSSLRAIGPIAGAPFAFLLLGETMSPIQIAGAAIVLITSLLIARKHRK